MLFRVLKIILDILFPPSQDEKLLAEVDTATFVKSVYMLNHIKRDVLAVSSFKHPTIRACIHLNKFHNHKTAQSLLAQILSQYLATVTKDVLLIPIPLSDKRLRARGHNQVLSILSKLPSNERYKTLTTLLYRTKDTAPQTTLTKKERHTNLKKAFYVSQKTHIAKDVHLVLIDDVTTTGTTLTEAKKAFAQAGFTHVTCVALAH